MFFNNLNKNIDNNSYYELLGVDKNANERDIIKAYRKKAMKEHPDKGGDPDKFKELTEAYDVLKDKNKRATYDSGGEDALSGMGGMGGMGGDIFSSMFGMNGGKDRKRKNKPTEFTINVTYNEIFNGSTRKIRLTRKTIDSNNIFTCKNCNGNGMILKQMRMGPMIQQIQSNCDKCNGEGSTYKSEKVKEIIEIIIPKGVPNNHRIILYEKGDDILNGETGDVHIILKELPHQIFKRSGFDLVMNKDISLYEALSGFNMIIEHLDNRKLLIKNRNNIIKQINFDPFNKKTEWELLENNNCTLEPYAKAHINDLKKIKELLTNGDLKNENITAFSINNKQTTFFKNDESDIRDNLENMNNILLYIKNNNESGNKMFCIENEGFEVFENPLLNGNLFINFNIIFPDTLDSKLLDILKNLNNIEDIDNEDDYELCTIQKQNPYESFEKNKIKNNEEDYNDDNMDNNVQCSQQ